MLKQTSGYFSFYIRVLHSNIHVVIKAKDIRGLSLVGMMGVAWILKTMVQDHS